MVSINYSAREVCCKIVYYGPGLSGKTTNLQYVHSKVPQSSRGKLISLATEADRTLYFDFLPINIGTINGFQAKFQLYTVPGQVYYNATRKLVLRGVDGLVFVADSQPDKMDENIESLENLEDNLREYGYDPDTMPLVIQYNKQDLPGVLSVEELDEKLNKKGRPTYCASATIGNGVFDTLKLIIKLVLEKAKSGSENLVATPTVSPSAETVAVKPKPISPTPQLQSEVTREPVYEMESIHSDSKIASEQTSMPPVPPVEPVREMAAVSSELANRPFPGGREAAARRSGAHKIPPAGVSGELSAEAISKNIGSDTYSEDSMKTVKPHMAPSLRRRGEKKKRGFFKRLFGIR